MLAQPLQNPERGEHAMKWDSKQMVGRAASVATIWGIGKVLSTPSGQRVTKKVDKKVTKVERKVAGSVRRGARNAADNSLWLTAGLATLAVATALLTKAAKGR